MTSFEFDQFTCTDLKTLQGCEITKYEIIDEKDNIHSSFDQAVFDSPFNT